jgi:acyl-[acyl-carrier-protein]-phospholipid O-acyltransferase/long-chain-fatty-acid--[acyl-carrier-protein] ligase
MRRTFNPADAELTLFGALLAAQRRFGRTRQILEDADRKPLTYGQLVLGSLVLGGKIAAMTTRREAVGVLLPNAAGLAITLFALSAYGRVAALLNFTAGPKNIRSAIETARVRVVLTSRRFIEAAKLDDLVDHIAGTTGASGERVTVVYLEDVRRSIGTLDKVRGAASAAVAAFVHRRYALEPGDPATILFTSGTEGSPKGVAL